MRQAESWVSCNQGSWSCSCSWYGWMDPRNFHWDGKTAEAASGDQKIQVFHAAVHSRM